MEQFKSELKTIEEQVLTKNQINTFQSYLQELKNYLIVLHNTTVNIDCSSDDILDYADIPEYIGSVCGFTKSAAEFAVEAINIYAAVINSGKILVLDRNNIKGYDEFDDDMRRKFITIDNQLAVWAGHYVNSKNPLFDFLT